MLKKAYSSGIIWNWTTMPLTRLNNYTSRNTYKKYVKKLIGLGWIKQEGENIRLVSRKELEKKYSLSDKVKLVRVLQSKKLKNDLEFAIIKNVLRAEEIAKNHRQPYIETTASSLVEKISDGVKSTIKTVLENDVSISLRGVSKRLGYSALWGITGKRKMDAWCKEGKIRKTNRRKIISDVEYSKLLHARIRAGNNYYQQLPNEIQLMARNFGFKGNATAEIPIPVIINAEGYRSSSTSFHNHENY